MKIITSYDRKKYIQARVYALEYTTRDGKKFNAYKILETKTHKRVDLRFTRDVANLPTQDCYIVVPRDKINKDINRDFPCYWVREITDILPLQVSQKDVSEFFETDDTDNDD